jgi:nicotinate-nucleotide adenylyltransferase
MVARAAASNPLFEASDLETAIDEPSFTFHTLELLSSARPTDEFVFILGADVAAGLERWREPQRVLELARLGVASRPGTALEDAEAAIQRLGGSERAAIVEMPEIGVSSSGIRKRVAGGEPIRYLVADGVEELIIERGLYAG